MNYDEDLCHRDDKIDLVNVEKNFLIGDNLKIVFWSKSTLDNLFEAGYGLFSNTDFKFTECEGFKVANFYDQKPIANYVGVTYLNEKNEIKDFTNVICNNNESVCIDGDKLLCYGPYVNDPFDVDKVNCGFYFHGKICKLYPLRDIFKLAFICDNNCLL